MVEECCRCTVVVVDDVAAAAAVSSEIGGVAAVAAPGVVVVAIGDTVAIGVVVVTGAIVGAVANVSGSGGRDCPVELSKSRRIEAWMFSSSIVVAAVAAGVAVDFGFVSVVKSDCKWFGNAYLMPIKKMILLIRI